jgi:hypothetical protein
MPTNINCIYFKSIMGCTNPKRKCLFGLVQNSLCKEINGDKCNLKEKIKKPTIFH